MGKLTYVKGNFIEALEFWSMFEINRKRGKIILFGVTNGKLGAIWDYSG